MIRYVHIRKQDDVLLDDDGEGVDGFAWWDTVTDSFLSFNGEQCWENWQEFQYDFDREPQSRPLQRFAQLIPAID